MKIYHTNRYKQIVVCKNRAPKICSSETHITEEEKNFLTENNYVKHEFNGEQLNLHLGHINSAYYKKVLSAKENKQYGARPSDYLDFHYNKARRIDPFALSMLQAPNLDKEYEDDQKYNENSDSNQNAEFKPYFNHLLAPKGKYKPNKAYNFGLVYSYFENVRKINIPEGTLTRTTKPSPSLTDLVAPLSKQRKILNINRGTSRYQKDSIFCSATWLGKNGWLYNVEITQTILDAN
jgi:hypothetical protein